MIDEHAIYAELDTVLDPELDQALTSLGFIEGAEIGEDEVTVRFRLPTYWCAANFAYLMASDIRARVGAVPGVKRVRVLLLDHYAEDEISEGVNAGRPFTEVFDGQADDELEELRQTFARKAFLVRQEQLLRALLRAGYTPETLASMTTADLRVTADARLEVRAAGDDGAVEAWRSVAGAARIYALWRQKRAALGLETTAAGPAFTTADGEALAPDRVLDHLRAARMVRLNGVFNTMLCTGLNRVLHGVGVGDVEELPDSLCAVGAEAEKLPAQAEAGRTEGPLGAQASETPAPRRGRGAVIVS